MTNDTAIVLVSVISAGGLHILAQFADKGRSVDLRRPIIGTVALGILLLLMAEVWPAGARNLAIVVLLTAFVMNGQKFAKLVENLVA